MKIKPLAIQRLTIGQTSKLFGITKNEFNLKTSLIILKYLLGWEIDISAK